MYGQHSEFAFEALRISNESHVKFNNELTKRVEYLEAKSSFTGLTTDELQSIHGLIQSQIALISSLQTSDDALKVHSAVTPLAILVSLVSKSTD